MESKNDEIEEFKLSEEVKILVSRQEVYYDDQQEEGGRELREFSEIIVLRKFNNFIKAVLINKYFNRQQFRNFPSILDLCSGRGGDIKKWQRLKPSHYVAIEYQEALIDKAIERLKEMKYVKYPSIFVVADAGDPNTTIDQVL
jgi:mRNA (guanine-N7-)-methyltransferase